MKIYLNGTIINKADAGISPDDRGFLFGDGVYEVIRVYNGKLFMINEHLARLERNLKELQITGVDITLIDEISRELIAANHLHNDQAIVYVQITRGVAPRTHNFPAKETTPTFYVSITPFQPPVEKWNSGVKIIFLPDTRWSRCDIKSISLLPNVLAKQQAEEADAHEAVFVRNGIVTEGSHTSVCFVINGEIVTHPQDRDILIGITRGLVQNLCQSLHISFKEKSVPVDRIKNVDEMMLLGTTTEIMPVVKADDHIIGNGKPGPLTRKLQQCFREYIDSFLEN